MNIFDGITRLIDQAGRRPEGYEKDGLIHCPHCHTPRQTVVTNPITGKESKVGCVCKCMKEAMDAEAEEARRKERERASRRRKEMAFDHEGFKDCLFENDDLTDPKMAAKMRRYAENFPRFLERGHGLLLYGDVGTGKTFYSACIANRLLQDGYKVLMTNFPTLIAKIQKEAFKTDVVGSLDDYDLLIIDDLGVERSSEYMQEQVYNIIDARYRAGKPVVVSTNLTAQELKNPRDVMAARIYGRILERCLPVLFEGMDRRKQNACHKEMLEVLNG